MTLQDRGGFVGTLQLQQAPRQNRRRVHHTRLQCFSALLFREFPTREIRVALRSLQPQPRLA